MGWKDVEKVDNSGLLLDEPDVEKEGRTSPVEERNQERKLEEKPERKTQENIKGNCRIEKSGSSTPERSEKSKKGPNSSGAIKSQDVPKKLKPEEVYDKAPGRSTEIKKTTLGKELEKGKD